MILSSKNKKRLNFGIIIAIDLIPLFGVMFWKWTVSDALFIFWLQTIVIGLMNFPKIIVYYKKYPVNMFWAIGLFGAGFILFLPFTFIWTYFISVVALRADAVVNDLILVIFLKDLILKSWIVILAIFIAEIYKFYSVFILEREYEEGRNLPASIPSDERIYDPTFEPFGRMLAIGVLPILSFWLIMLFNSPLPALMIFIVGKIIVDIQIEKYHKEKESKTTSNILTK